MASSLTATTTMRGSGGCREATARWKRSSSSHSAPTKVGSARDNAATTAAHRAPRRAPRSRAAGVTRWIVRAPRKEAGQGARVEEGAKKSRGPKAPRDDFPTVNRRLLLFRRFLAAGLLGTFGRLFASHSVHHLSCRTGPPGRAYLAKNAGRIRQTVFRVLENRWKTEGTTTFNID